MTTNDSFQALAIVRSTELQRQLVEALSGHRRVRLDARVGALKTQGAVLQGAAPDVLLLEVDVDDAEDMAALNRITSEAAQRHVPVLTTARDLSTVGVRRLLREGVADFLPQPLDASEFLEALYIAARSRRPADPPSARGRILAFARASGGVGTTTLAVNAAWSLLEARRREGAAVCLIDFDVQFGTAALQLDLEPLPGMLQIVEAPERLDAALFLGSLAEHGSGLRVLTAPPTPMPLDALRPEIAAKLLEFARSEFDYVVLDLPLALASWTETVLTQADLLFLVMQLHVPAVRQTRRLLDTLQDEGLYSLPLKLVLNRDRGGFAWSAGVRRRQGEKALGRSVDYIIPDEPEVVLEAINQGRPVLELKRRSGFSKKLRAMVEGSLAELPVRAPGKVSAAA